MGGCGVWVMKDGEESPMNRDRRRATCWNWRSVGRLGAGVLSARGWPTMSAG